MDICFECKKNKAITILLCGDCDDKLKEQIKKKMRDNYNWPFGNNYGKLAYCTAGLPKKLPKVPIFGVSKLPKQNSRPLEGQINFIICSYVSKHFLFIFSKNYAKKKAISRRQNSVEQS